MPVQSGQLNAAPAHELSLRQFWQALARSSMFWLLLARSAHLFSQAPVS